MVQVGGETTHGLSDTLMPCRVIDGRVQVIHASRIRLLSVLSAENWGVKKHVSDVVEVVVLNLDFVGAAKVVTSMGRPGVSNG